mmetsp:Transcript_9347/g.8809  ORF Transcript_9347/g.8809 Transcript_9347/m.8809 type:complete len:212 (-) Transcript_9347:1260-1895(-)
MLLVVFPLSIIIGVEPVLGISDGFIDLLLVISIQFVSQLLLILNGVPHGVDVVLQGVLGINLLFQYLVLLSKLLSILDHSFDFFFAKSSLVISDGNTLGGSSSFLHSVHTQNTVLIDFKGDFDLRNSSRSRRNAVEIKLAKIVVVLGHSSLSFKHLDGHSGLLVLVGCEGLRFLGRDHSSSGDDLSHNSSYSLNTKGQRSHINEKDIFGLF